MLVGTASGRVLWPYIDEGRHSSPAKLNVGLFDIFPPTNATGIRSFLGVFGFYKRFVADYVAVSAPLMDLMHNNSEWAWPEANRQAFDTLKARLFQAPVLVKLPTSVCERRRRILKLRGCRGH